MRRTVLFALILSFLCVGSAQGCYGLYLPLEISRVGGALHVQMTGFDFDNAQAAAVVLGAVNVAAPQGEVVLDFDDIRATYGNWALQSVATLTNQSWIIPVSYGQDGMYHVDACSHWARVDANGYINAEYNPITTYTVNGFGWDSLQLLREEVASLN